jgi:hypothetical protein
MHKLYMLVTHFADEIDERVLALAPHAIDNQYKALLLCQALVQQPLAEGSLYESPLLSYVAMRCVGRHGAWRAPRVVVSILQRLCYGMHLTLLGASRAKWLLLRDSGPLPSAPTAAQATEALHGLHQQWLCGTESRLVGSALDNLALYVKLVARHSLPSRTIYERLQ